MPQALPLSTQISQSSQSQTNFRVLTARYGNGYEQRVADGINSSTSSWNVSWENILLTEFTTIKAAFDAAKGVDYFTWIAPGDVSVKRWVVASYTASAASGNIYTISAELRQVHDIT